MFGAPSSSGTTTTQHLKGSICHCCGCLRKRWHSRMLFWRAPLPNTCQLTGFCVQITVVSLMISMINFYPRSRHTCEGDRNMNPNSIVQGLIFRLQVRLALRLRATSAFYRSSTGFPPISGLAARADFPRHDLERHRACSSINTSPDESPDVP